MGRIDIKAKEPEHYAQVMIEQEEIKNSIKAKLSITLSCPFCGHTAGKFYKGTTFSTFETKCDYCGEFIVFPPLTFSRIRSYT